MGSQYGCTAWGPCKLSTRSRNCSTATHLSLTKVRLFSPFATRARQVIKLALSWSLCGLIAAHCATLVVVGEFPNMDEVI